MFLIEAFDKAAGQHPQRVCLADASGEGFTYQECVSLSCRIANGLRAMGVERGQTVGMLGPNHLMALLAVLGIIRSQAVWLPVNARNSLEENVQILVRGKCRILFLHSALQEHLPALREAVPGVVIIGLDAGFSDVESMDRWMRRYPDTRWQSNTAADDLIAIRGTGGTTGLPKGVMVTQGMFQAMIDSCHAWMPVSEPPVHLIVAPLTHAAGTLGLILSTQGATNIVLGSTDPGAILAAIERFKVDILFLPPTLIYRLLAHPALERHDYGSLKYFIYSAAPMSVDRLIEAWCSFGPVMTQLYGQAEAPMFCTCLTPADHAAALQRGDRSRLASCGKASTVVEIKVVDESGHDLPIDEVGEIVVRGALAMPGYFENPAATNATIVDGWLHTGDLGYRDEDGYFYIVDRKKDLIISGGFNIFPGQIEQVLMSHPDVADCAVIGVPDDQWGEAVKAVIELKPGGEAASSQFMTYCRDRLGGIKTPKSVEVWPELPRSAVGKILKNKIREQYWPQQGRRI